jgi:hypothetical protein
MTVLSWTADTDGGSVTEYKTTVERSFPVHQG